jgi:hypothetical protein
MLCVAITKGSNSQASSSGTQGGMLSMQVAFGSDAFGSGCQTQQCGYPMDCGVAYPQVQFQAPVTGSCYFQPPFAVSSPNVQLCQSCDTQYNSSNLPIPQTVLYTPQKGVNEPRPTFAYKMPTSCPS